MVLFIVLYIITLLTNTTATQIELGGSWPPQTAWVTAWVTALWPCCLDGTKAPRHHSLGDTAPWPAVTPSVASMASSWLLSCSWGETPSQKNWHRCAVETEASHHSRRNFWRGYMGQTCLRAAFSTKWSRRIYWCQQLSNIWASRRGMSVLRKSGLKADVCSQLRNFCYGEEMGEFCSCMSVQGFCDIQRYFRDFKKLL